MVTLLEYKYFKIISHLVIIYILNLVFRTASSFNVHLPSIYLFTLLLVTSGILRYPRGNTRQLQKTKSQQNEAEKRWKLTNCRVITNFHLSYGFWVRKYKNITITLQKEQEYPLKFSFCFQISDSIVIHVYILEHWDCTTRQHSCTKLTHFGTVSMPNCIFSIGETIPQKRMFGI